MKYVLTNLEMREADEYTVEEKGFSSALLMDAAGKAIAKEARALAPKGRVLCVCGGGNNGGDGFVCARVLKGKRRAVDVVCFAERFSAECETEREKWLAVGGEIFQEMPDREYAIIVDCMFGTGYHGCLEGAEKQTALKINEGRKKGAVVLAADVPSGVDGKNGRVKELAVQADVTLCFGALKIGALLNDGIDYAGEVKRADIGIVLPRADYGVLVDKALVQAFLPARRRNSHKGSYGKAAIVAGSQRYTGSAYLALAGCLRGGVGYTTLFAPQSLLPLYVLKSPEALLHPVCDGGMYAFNEECMRPLCDFDAVAYGMGMGCSEEVCKGATWLLENYEGKLILDADGLNSLAQYGDIEPLMAMKKCDVLLTPHAKEFSRLSGLTVEEILSSGVDAPKVFAKKWGCKILLKGATSILTDGEKLFLCAVGNSGQAKAGSGDVLSGLIPSIAAQKCSLLESAICGSFLAGQAADLAAREEGEYSLTATDILARLGKSFLLVTKDANKEGGEE